MEYIILSMLLFKAMTVYEIRNYIIKNLTTVCSNSLGSIQTAIKKILSKGFIEVNEYVENGLNKKKYNITDKGLVEYKKWVGTPINLSKMTNMEESKLFFLGVAPKEKRIAFLVALNKDLEEQLKALTAIQEFALTAKEAVIKDNISNISIEHVSSLPEASTSSHTANFQLCKIPAAIEKSFGSAYKTFCCPADELLSAAF